MLVCLGLLAGNYSSKVLNIYRTAFLSYEPVIKFLPYIIGIGWRVDFEPVFKIKVIILEC